MMTVQNIIELTGEILNIVFHYLIISLSLFEMKIDIIRPHGYIMPVILNHYELLITFA